MRAEADRAQLVAEGQLQVLEHGTGPGSAEIRLAFLQEGEVAGGQDVPASRPQQPQVRVVGPVSRGTVSRGSDCRQAVSLARSAVAAVGWAERPPG